MDNFLSLNLSLGLGRVHKIQQALKNLSWTNKPTLVLFARRKELSLSMFSLWGVFPTDRRRLTLLVQSLPPVPRARRAGRDPTWSAAPSWSPPAPQGTSCRPVCRRWWCRSPGTPPSAGPPGWRPARAAATARSPRSGCPGTPGLLLWGKPQRPWGQCHSQFNNGHRRHPSSSSYQIGPGSQSARKPCFQGAATAEEHTQTINQVLKKVTDNS